MQPTIMHTVRRTSFETMNCSVAQCLEVVGEWWSMLIIRDAFLGVRRFDDFQSRLGISRNILNLRLTTLVEAGVLERVPYQQRPPRFEYRLSDKGRDLWPVLTTMPRVGRQMGIAQRRPPRSGARRMWQGHAPQPHLQRLRPARRPTLTPPSARTRRDAQRLRPDHAGGADLSPAHPGGASKDRVRKQRADASPTAGSTALAGNLGGPMVAR